MSHPSAESRRSCGSAEGPTLGTTGATESSVSSNLASHLFLLFTLSSATRSGWRPVTSSVPQGQCCSQHSAIVTGDLAGGADALLAGLRVVCTCAASRSFCRKPIRAPLSSLPGVRLEHGAASFRLSWFAHFHWSLPFLSLALPVS